MNAPLLPISIALCLGLATYYGAAWTSGDRSAFLPGETTHGHYQIELDCAACHEPWGGGMQEACEGCHADELDMADDSHPKRKFTDPRNADRVAILDARECITCHVEHEPDLTSSMGLTQPEDYCVLCHDDIADERASHEGLGFETCASAGCHNFHDNLGLNEDYLEKHLDEPTVLPDPRLLSARAPVEEAEPAAATPIAPDAPADVEADPALLTEFAASAHALNEVSCTGCHAPEGAAWSDAVAMEACAECHDDNAKQFTSGKHGMRLAQGLGPMRPELARLPMHESAHGLELSCNSCHSAHSYDTREAATEACLGCHADEHSEAYESSPHAKLAALEANGHGPAGSGVTCATCHMPETQDPGAPRAIQHNQNANLRPNEKMVRTVCENCHGVGFSIDALADTELVRRNFRGQPSEHIESLDMVIEKLRGIQASHVP